MRLNVALPGLGAPLQSVQLQHVQQADVAGQRVEEEVAAQGPGPLHKVLHCGEEVEGGQRVGGALDGVQLAEEG